MTIPRIMHTKIDLLNRIGYIGWRQCEALESTYETPINGIVRQRCTNGSGDLGIIVNRGGDWLA